MTDKIPKSLRILSLSIALMVTDDRGQLVGMLSLYDLHSLYVHKETPTNIVGPVSLADAARIRSGSCRACMISRIDLNN